MNGHEILCKGKIIGYVGDYKSKIGNLMVKDSATGGIDYIFCATAPTENGFVMAFGAGNSVLDKEIYYSLDENMVLNWFIPVEEAGDDLIREYDETHIKH